MDEDRALEDRIVGTLRGKGLIAPPRGRGFPAWAMGFALLLVAGAGWLLLPRSDEPAGELYMLALYSGPYFRPDPGGSRAAEYGRWARTPGERGAAVVGGEELAPAYAVLGPPAAAEPPLAGYFLIRAPGPEAALALARTTPHLRHGGTIALRPVIRH